LPSDHVALLQADGRYDLELGRNSGDYSDFFRYDFFGGVDFLFPSYGEPLLGPFPNTDSYGKGVVAKTNHYISRISGKNGNNILFDSFILGQPHNIILPI
jgi:hypothetical protein